MRRVLVLFVPFLVLGTGTVLAAEVPDAPPAPAFSVPRVLTIDSLEGSVRIQRGSTSVRAAPGTLVHESETLQLESRSKARLSIGDQTLIELGPSTRLRVQQLGREDGGGMANLRLDYGYMRIVWADPEGKRDRPAAISFGKWAAMVSSGEFFFEAGKGRARACGLAGDLVFAGMGSDAPKRVNGSCADLPAGKQSTTVTPSGIEWQAMRDQFTLRPDLRRVTAAKDEGRPLPAPVVAAATAGAAPTSDHAAYLLVEAVTGTATAVRDAGTAKLAIGQRVDQGQRVETGADSGLRLSMKDEDTPFELGPTFELGPNTRATVRKLPGAVAGSALLIRLDEGAMGVLREPGENASIPLEVSFSKWAARLKLGEFFLESRADSATACLLSGDMTLIGVPSSLPKAAENSCTGLTADEAPRDVPLPEVDALREIVAVQRVLRSQLPVPYIVGPTSNAAGAAPAPATTGSASAPRAVEATLRPDTR